MFVYKTCDKYVCTEWLNPLTGTSQTFSNDAMIRGIESIPKLYELGCNILNAKMQVKYLVSFKQFLTAYRNIIS